jgi:hypothetical protein
VRTKHARAIRRGIEAAREVSRCGYLVTYYKPSGRLAERAFDRIHDRTFSQWIRAAIEAEGARRASVIRESARDFRKARRHR